MAGLSPEKGGGPVRPAVQVVLFFWPRQEEEVGEGLRRESAHRRHSEPVSPFPKAADRRSKSRPRNHFLHNSITVPV